MAYATVALIQANFKDTTFSSSTNVKDTEVTQMIVEADALINSYVGTRYVVPVAAGEGLQTLSLLSQSLVAARIKKILEVKQATAEMTNQNVLSVLLSVSEVLKILKDLQKGDSVLVGATPLVSGGGFYNNNVTNDIEPVMEKDSKQW